MAWACASSSCWIACWMACWVAASAGAPAAAGAGGAWGGALSLGAVARGRLPVGSRVTATKTTAPSTISSPSMSARPPKPRPPFLGGGLLTSHSEALLGSMAAQHSRSGQRHLERTLRSSFDLTDQVVVVERLLDHPGSLMCVLFVHQAAISADDDHRNPEG